MNSDCLILGAGLSGLYAAHCLQRQGLRSTVLEARERLGGRVLSLSLCESDQRFDLGPAWLWPEFQPLLADLSRKLGVGLFAQQTTGVALYDDPNQINPIRMEGPSPNAQSYRVAGGTLRLIEVLAATLPADTFHLGQRVVELHYRPNAIEVVTVDPHEVRRSFHSPQVISTVPLRLLVETIRFEPPLPTDQRRTFAATPTWMAAHAKLLVCYDSPFWRKAGLSGEVFSRRGPLSEIYDASPANGGPYALFGFFGLPSPARHQLGVEELTTRVIKQLQRLFGAEAGTPLHLEFKDWSDDPLTATPADATAPAGHPTYGLTETLRSAWQGRLLFAGSEAAEINGGYLEGALESAAKACAQIGQNRK